VVTGDAPLFGESTEDVQAVVTGRVVWGRDPGTAIVFDLDADTVPTGTDCGSDGEGATG
jgi:hypothetical protein